MNSFSVMWRGLDQGFEPTNATQRHPSYSLILCYNLLTVRCPRDPAIALWTRRLGHQVHPLHLGAVGTGATAGAGGGAITGAGGGGTAEAGCRAGAGATGGAITGGAAAGAGTTAGTAMGFGA